MKKFTISKESLKILSTEYINNHGATSDTARLEERAYRKGFVECMNIINKKLEEMGLIDKKGGE